MGRMYSASFENIAVTAVQDVLNIVMAANKSAWIHSLYLGQTNLTGQEVLEIKATRATGNGTGGALVTPNPLVLGAGATGATIRRNDTTQGTPGAIVLQRVWNVLVPFEYLPIPEDRIHIPGGGRVIFEIETAPSASMTTYGELVWEEMG